ncbi:SHOCT domain-containing protein [Idiomarina piscisalsi]|uniref:YokE-like PH domain-containing protein n=1 Tax=Idiomarina piscisalsi TaxID=1096243 RepID=A0A432YWX8_9GAMM|nr:SHOCT domain-containing protein [Idiomarina piscisalsi]RUO67829.1 hypothetical protein CWI73_02935 [Idiomarina piscisalsi]
MKKESKHVKAFKERHAQSGENVIAWADGYIGEMMGKGDKTQHNGVLIVSETRVIFYRKGLMGEVLETIPLKSITSVERQSLLGHRVIRLHASHDDLEFKTFEKEGETSLVNAIEAGRSQQSVSSAKQIENNSDPIEKLKKLAELKNSGVITEEEFNTKKSKLLEEM